MYCENTFCIYWSCDACLLDHITINAQGECDACIFVGIEEAALFHARQKQLALYEMDEKNFASKR